MSVIPLVLENQFQCAKRSHERPSALIGTRFNCSSRDTGGRCKPSSATLDRIESSDPEALDKLRRRMSEAEVIYKQMVLINRTIAEVYAGRVLVSRAGVDRVGRLLYSRGVSPAVIDGLFAVAVGARLGYERATVDRAGARYRRYRNRLIELVAARGVRSRVADHGEFSVEVNQDDHRVRIRFAVDHGPGTGALLTDRGFVWSRANQAYQRVITKNSLVALEYIEARLMAMGRVLK